MSDFREIINRASGGDADRKWAEVSDLDKNIAMLISRGVKLWSVGDNLRFSAPLPGILTPDVTQWLIEHKAPILAILASRKEES